jgi:circadian clock protein KaiC
MNAERGAAHEWIETGVPQLDRVLGGGLVRGWLASVIGAPGAGKTVMAQQLAFHHASRGHTALFLTGYSETHDQLLRHSRSLSFFRAETVGDGVQFASMLDLLGEGAEQTQEAIVGMARSQNASLVIVDGFHGMRRLLGEEAVVAGFLYGLRARLSLLGVTTLLIVEADPDEAGRYPELTMCDLIVTLRRELRGTRQRRLLQVVKARGASALDGVHPFTITGDGVSVFPRFESRIAPADVPWDPGRATFGVEALDAMLGGGLNVGTATLVAGSPGVGKTLLGLHFVTEGARRGEPTLFLGFMESAEQLRERARTFGLDLADAEAAGLVRLLVLPGYDLEGDYIAHLLSEDVERRGVRRLVVDSAAELERSFGTEERQPGFLSALVGYLRSRRVTSYLTLDIPTIAGPSLELARTPLSVLAENLLLLRIVEYRGALHRVVSALKMRFSDHDRTINEYTITTETGLRLSGPAPRGAGLLTGVAHPLIDLPPPSRPDGG